MVAIPVGQTVYDGNDRPITVVGIIELMHGAMGRAGTSSTT